MMGLLGQPYKVRKELHVALKELGAIKNVAIPNTLELKKMPAELGLDACLDSQSRNKKR